MLKFLVACAAIWFLISAISNRGSGTAPETNLQLSTGTAAVGEKARISPLESLEQSQASVLAPTGDLADIFEFGTDSTDLQRQLKFKEVSGTVIEWTLPVYEVKQSGDGYTIQTSSRFRGESIEGKVIGTFLHISPRDENDRRYVERLKTGDLIKVKGVISDVTMRNLKIMPAIIIDDDRYAKKTLTDAYGQYNQKYNCWHVSEKHKEGEEKYCMKIGRVDKKNIGPIIRYYILALGEHVDEDGKPNGFHAVYGLVGAFVVEIKHGTQELIASNSMISMGALGSAPRDWKLVGLGATDYWGWQTEWGDCHHGNCDSQHVILAPYGKQVKNLTEDFSSFSDGEEQETSHETKLAIDSTKGVEKVYPLNVTTTGKAKGKAIAKKTVNVAFDYKNWKYQKPKN